MTTRTISYFAASSNESDVGLLEWLQRHALPIWALLGVDRAGGGFFEKIGLGGRALEEPRRTRVVARQIYVFAVAARRGWLAEADAHVEHGLTFLLSRCRLPEGYFATSVRADGAIVDPAFDLYEQAFALFALAAAARDRPDRAGLQTEALALFELLRTRHAHPIAGFEEAVPRSLPLRSNPHMHLLEAALEWEAVATGDARIRWVALADELAVLCLDRFIDPASGALRENFDGGWQPMSGAPGRLVEPGHQFEWAWLLMRWATLRDRPDALAAARRLLRIGEVHGVDPVRGVAVNALDDALKVIDPAAKVWPQTERIKAWHQARSMARDAAEAAAADAALRDATRALARYLTTEPRGLWHEQMEADGSFVPQACRASSLYHIVCAIDTLQDEPQPGRTA